MTKATALISLALAFCMFTFVKASANIFGLESGASSKIERAIASERSGWQDMQCFFTKPKMAVKVKLTDGRTGYVVVLLKPDSAGQAKQI